MTYDESEDSPVRAAGARRRPQVVRVGDILDAIRGQRLVADADGAVKCLVTLYASKHRWRSRFKALRSALSAAVLDLREAGLGEIADRLAETVADPNGVLLEADGRRSCCAACRELRAMITVALDIRRRFAALRDSESRAEGPGALAELDAPFARLDEAVQLYNYAHSGTLSGRDDPDPEL